MHERRESGGEKKIPGRGKGAEKDTPYLENRRKFKVDEGRGSDRRGEQTRTA